MSESILPVLAGLAVGLGLIVAFAMFSAPAISDTHERVWVAKYRMQCAPEKWEESGTPLASYFDERGIKVYASQVLPAPFPDGVVTCTACYCASQNKLFLQVDSGDISMMAEYGFSQDSPENY